MKTWVEKWYKGNMKTLVEKWINQGNKTWLKKNIEKRRKKDREGEGLKCETDYWIIVYILSPKTIK